MPQESINEIHGGWFDPSNPVVPMTSRLRQDLVTRLRQSTDSSDLVIAMGTSLSGVAADQLVSIVGRRAADEARRRQEKSASAGDWEKKGKVAVLRDKVQHAAASGRVAALRDEVLDAASPTLGSVIINVQQTRLDGAAVLRIFAKLDTVWELLAKELGLEATGCGEQAVTNGLQATPVSSKARKVKEHGALEVGSKGSDVWAGLPYDPKTGILHEGSERSLEATDDAAGASLVIAGGATSPKTAMLDLNPGRLVRLAHGNAPMAVEGTQGHVGQKTAQGHYRIHFDDGKTRMLGSWMLMAASAGKLERLPILNVA